MTKRLNARRIPVNLGISRGIGPDGFPRYTLDVIDDLSGYPIAHVEMTGDEFARAITGQQMNRLNGTIPSREGVDRLGLKENLVAIAGFPRDWHSDGPELTAWVEHARETVGAQRVSIRGTNTGSANVTFYWYTDPLQTGIDAPAVQDQLRTLRDTAVEAGHSTTT